MSARRQASPGGLSALQHFSFSRSGLALQRGNGPLLTMVGFDARGETPRRLAEVLTSEGLKGPKRAERREAPC